MFKKLILISIFFQISIGVNGQTIGPLVKDSSKKKLVKEAISPVSLIILGSLISGGAFEVQLQKDIRNITGNDFFFGIDDYLIFVPVIEMYSADVIGLKAKNHWFNQTKYLVISDLLSAVLVFPLKNITKKIRPNGLNWAFPSGHVTFAFTHAGVLFQEFKDSNLRLAYSGYGFAALTGVFRMLNNKHWLSDVLVGAGIGILIPQLVYHFEPLKNWNPIKGIKNVSFAPQIGREHYGIYAQIKF